jgi:hypothetical protein
MWNILTHLKKFLAYYRPMLHGRSILLLLTFWALAVLSVEAVSHFPEFIRARFWLPIAAILINIISIIFILAAQRIRLLEIVRGFRGAEGLDLAISGFAYIFIILAFAAVYMSCDILAQGTAFKYPMNQRSWVHIVDYVYLSGITIATVGYGDMVPLIWYTKLLTVAEVVLGIGLTVIVLGFAIGSLLGRHLYEQQARFLTGFRIVYLKALTRHEAGISSISELEYEEYVRLQQALLDTIVQLVTLQYTPSPTAKVSANWMQLYKGSNAPKTALDLARKFVPSPMRTDGAMRGLWGLLVLKEWNERPPLMPDKGEFALPVYNPASELDLRYQLEGAPQAISSDSGYVVIPDTSKITFSNQDEEVRQNLQEYFRERAPDIKSFVSVSIMDEETGDTFGVINIQSNELHLCGATPEVQRLLVDMLRPFAAYLLQLELIWSSREETPAHEGSKNS